ncbi:MAG: hypothetical protein Q4G03_04215 [Planctomycetia bacterium]|nr:hypothetical protein [Planctomycetia bacterium]
MTNRFSLRLCVCLTCLALLPFLFPYANYGDYFHEIAATLTACVVAVHLWYNRRWFARLWNRTNHWLPRVSKLIAFACFALFVIQFLSGVALSKKLFHVPLFDAWIAQARGIHLSCSHWLLLLVPLHSGLCLSWRIKRLASTKGRRIIKGVVSVLLLALASRAFLRQKITSYLFLKSAFIFVDPNLSTTTVTLDFIALILGALVIGYWLARTLARKQSRTIDQ